MTTISWHVFSILVWAATPPTMHQKFEAIALPVPYKTEAECNSSKDWLNANMPRTPTPSNDTKQVFVCVPIGI